MLHPLNGYSSVLLPVRVLGQESFIIISNFLTYVVMKVEDNFPELLGIEGVTFLFYQI